MKKKRIFLVVAEEHMYASLKPIKERFESLGFEVTVIFNPFNITPSLWERIVNGRKYIKNLTVYFANTISNLDINENDVVIYSCGEGFEISNLEKWKPKVFNFCTECAIMHGTLDLKSLDEKNFLKKSFKKIINFISSLLLNINLLGKGFGGVYFDYYIVYASRYKDYLINERGWKESNVIVSGLFIKSSMLQIPVTPNNNCIFLLQNLPLARQMAIDKYKICLSKIIYQLSCNYDKVKIRLHPKMDYNLYANVFEGFHNVIVMEKGSSLHENLQDVSIAYSFPSTALIDVNILKIPVVGIVLPSLPLSLYDFIKTKVNYNKITDFIHSAPDLSNCSISEDEIYLEDNVSEVIEKLTSKI